MKKQGGRRRRGKWRRKRSTRAKVGHGTDASADVIIDELILIENLFILIHIRLQERKGEEV